MNDIIAAISEEIRKEVDFAFRDGRLSEVVKVLLRNVSKLSQQNYSLQFAFVVIVRKRDAQRSPVAYRPIAVLSTGRGITPPEGVGERSGYSKEEIKEKLAAELQNDRNIQRDTVSFSTFPQSTNRTVEVCPSCGGNGLRTSGK